MSNHARDESYIRAVYTGNAHPPLDEREAEHEFDRILTRVKAEAWENGVRASRAYDRQLTRWGKGDGGGGPFAPPEELRNPYTED